MRRPIAIAVATAGALAIWATAELAASPLQVQSPGRPAIIVGPALVAVTAVAAGLAGWGLLTLLERFTKRPRAIWTWTAIVALTASLVMPFSVDADASTVLWLELMHVAVGAVLILMLPRTARRASS